VNMTWEETLAWLEAERLAEEQYQNIVDRANNWETCVCSELNVPKGYKGLPLDYELQKLGKKFARLIIDSDWEEARHVLDDSRTRGNEIFKNNS